MTKGTLTDVTWATSAASTYNVTWESTQYHDSWNHDIRGSIKGIDIVEEMRLRDENDFVKGLYEEYKMAVVLAHGDNE